MGFITTTDEHIASGGTITGDLTIDADLTITGSTAITTNEVIQGTSTIDVTSATALVVRRDSSGGDIFIVDTDNRDVTVSDTLILNPTISSGSETTLAFQRSGTNKWRFIQPSDDTYLKLYNDQASATQMYFKSDNTIGIGNTAPAKALHIGDASNNSGNGTIRLQGYSAGGSGNYHDIVSYGDNLALYRNTTLLMHLNYNGKVGIGETVPLGILHIKSADSGISTLDTGGDELVVEGSGAAGISILAGASSVAGLYFPDSSDANRGFLRYDHNTDAMTIRTNNADAVIVNSSGNVGIGGTPTSKLHIHDSVDGASIVHFDNIAGGSSSVNETMALHLNLGDGSTIRGGAKITAKKELDYSTGANMDSSLMFSVLQNNAFNDALFISSAGNLGVGSSEPTHGKVEIVGDADAFQLVMSDVADSDDTTKEVRMGMMHYKQAEEPVTLFYAQSGSSTNSIYIGGGTGSGNHATSVAFATASTYNSTSTTTNMVIDNNSRISLSNNDASGAVGTTLFGYNAGLNIVSGAVHNTFIGHAVADASLTNAADYNTGVGGSALSALTSGYSNVAVGFQALVSNTDGLQNTAIGTSALYYNVGTDNNTALGDQAGMYTTGASNTYVGQSAGRGASGADASNVGVGMQALKVITSGSENVSIGKDSMYDADTASGVVAVGAESAYNITSGSESVAIGKQALYTATTVGANTAVGYQALKLSTAASNTAVGHSALAANASGTNNIAIGKGAIATAGGSESSMIAIGADALGNMNNNSSSQNMAIGVGAMDGVGTIIATNNIMVGLDAGGGTWTGSTCDANVGIGNGVMDAAMDGASNNTAVGHVALGALTTGDNNVAIGSSALTALNTGSANVAIGKSSMAAETDGVNNVAIGLGSLQALTSSSQNVAIGSGAMESMDDTADGLANCVAIGYQAFAGNATSTTTGANGTVAIGASALFSLTSGASNVAIGQSSLDACNTGSSNTAIGRGSLSGTVDGVSNVAVGAWSMGTGDAGNYNVAVGAECLVDVTGASNIGIGFQTLLDLTSGNQNIAMGHWSCKSMTGGETDNIAIGVESMSAVDETDNSRTADDNIAIGTQTLQSGILASGQDLIGNIAIGSHALNSTGTNGQTGTIAIGFDALTALTSGSGCTAVGYQSIDANDEGLGLTAFGYQSLSAQTGATNGTTAIGHRALHQNNANVTNDYSVAVGFESGDNQTNGYQNTFLGATTTGNDTSAVNQTVIGYHTAGQADNSVTLGNDAVTAVYMADDSGATVYCSGVNFPDTQAASGDANTLDDYEEGDWAPVVSDGTNNATMHGSIGGRYTKVGNKVTVTAYILVTSLGSVSGAIRVTGLPFAVADSNRNYSAFAVSSAEGLNITAGHSVNLTAWKNTSYAKVWLWDSATGGSEMTGAELSADGGFMISGSYLTT